MSSYPLPSKFVCIFLACNVASGVGRNFPWGGVAPEVQKIVMIFYSLAPKKPLIPHQNWAIFTLQSPRYHKRPTFFHKIKIAQNMWFPHRFSISGPKVTQKKNLEASGPPLALA